MGVLRGSRVSLLPPVTCSEDVALVPQGCWVPAGLPRGRASGPRVPLRTVGSPRSRGGPPRPGCAEGCGEVPAAGGSAGRSPAQAGARHRQGWPVQAGLTGPQPRGLQGQHLPGLREPAGTTEAPAAAPLQGVGLGCRERSAVPGD